ncbi:MAG: MerR family transcriptional regulator [Proteobacteria bacterium]|nr:MerR family transcriptional regulator [Pseudomonadota bacterium]MCH7892933.1 MerR family transcriptional regulator [Pseudomonadota bacterium]MCH8220019.1 MerR family transcriptional regulator [Pseudomonadota bacterium]
MSRNQPTIGTVARQVGVNVETIRYYQRIGLVKEPPKNGGFRLYSDKAVTRLLYIRHLKKLGFTLREITKLLEAGAKGCGEVGAILTNKRSEVLQKIEQMRAAAEELEQMEIVCRKPSSNGSGACPLIPESD